MSNAEARHTVRGFVAAAPGWRMSLDGGVSWHDLPGWLIVETADRDRVVPAFYQAGTGELFDATRATEHGTCLIHGPNEE